MSRGLGIFMAAVFIIAVGSLTGGLLSLVPSMEIPTWMAVFMIMMVLFMAGTIFDDYS